MADKIVVLPENIANQIAAGEVIQRPASAAKELLENAVDAGATQINLIIADAGKSLLQVIDNGSGMSETDARLCFERHATSKIKEIDDLFRIRTMGFRGEALASVAAVAQIELKSRRAEDEAGTLIEVENSQVIRQEPVAMAQGTSIAMKNLFFNVPARRNFLRSNAAELRHIIEEFTRVAMAFPQILFTLTSNGQQVFHLEPGSLKQRIVQLLGNHYNTRMVTVKEDTDYMNITGFTGKPETAKKTRGDQYFFVNNRFIRSPYLHHAVMNAYQEMISSDSFPMYVLFIDLDPEQVDVNVHPTKQEIKFEDEKIIYAFMKAAVRHALAQFSVTPTLDFDLDASIQQLPSVSQPFTTVQRDTVTGSSIFKGFTQKNQAHFIEPSSGAGLKSWRDFYAPRGNQSESQASQPGIDDTGPQKARNTLFEKGFSVSEHTAAVQVFNSYIILPGPESFLLINQQHAHERVLYQQMMGIQPGKPASVQRSMFPLMLELSPTDAVILTELLPDLALLGYLVEPFGKNSFVIQGTPAGSEAGNEKQLIEKTLEQFKNFNPEAGFSSREKLIRSIAVHKAVKAGTHLTEKEIHRLLAELFACDPFNISPGGHPTYLEFSKAQIEKMFGG